MPNWKFWEKSPAMAESTREVSDPELRFGLQPRTDLPGAMQTTDPAKADQLFRLRKRRETILFDVDQSELAVAEENPWKERILHLDEAIEAVRLDYGTASTAHDTPGDPFEPIPIDRISVDEGPPPAVRFTVGDQPFLYQEDQDWAERGFQLARDELHLIEGDPAALVAVDRSRADYDARLEFVTSALFVFASDMRDRSLNNEPLPASIVLTDLAKPDLDNGGWIDWRGHSPAHARKEAHLHELHAEEQRLIESRVRELEDLAKWEDRLPIARRRLAEVDAEIATLGG